MKDALSAIGELHKCLPISNLLTTTCDERRWAGARSGECATKGVLNMTQQVRSCHRSLRQFAKYLLLQVEWWSRGELNSRPLECHAYYLRHYSLNLPTKPYHFKAPHPTWLAVLGGCMHQSTDSRRYSDQCVQHERPAQKAIALLHPSQKVRSNCLDIKPFFFTVRVLSGSFWDGSIREG